MSETRRASQRKFHIIYKTTCLITGKWYIGMHSTDNLNDGYIGSGMRLWKSIDKYGKENHNVEILEYLPDRKSLALREEKIINEAKKDPMCMNIARGGEGWYDRPATTEETRKKLSEASKNYTRTKEWYDKIVATRKAGVGYSKSEEERQKIRKALTGKILSEEHKKKISEGGGGQKRSKETCENISKALRGKPKVKNTPMSEQHKESIRLARIGKKHSEEAKANMRKPKDMSKNKRKCTVDGINIFDSVKDLVKALGSGRNGSRSLNFRYI
jgi:group I intron endonuclease